MTDTILFVDDNAPIRRVMGRGLRLKGFTVLEAESAQKAIELFEAEGAGVRLLITDVMMPGGDGPTLARRLRGARPDLGVIFVSGYAEQFASTIDSEERIRVLTKPFSLDALMAAVAELLAD